MIFVVANIRRITDIVPTVFCIKTGIKFAIRRKGIPAEFAAGMVFVIANICRITDIVPTI